MDNNEELPFCECGKCGLRVTKPGNKYIIGHNFRDKHHTQETCSKMSDTRKGVSKPPRTPEHNAAISAAKTGVPNSPEHNDAIREGSRNSDDVKDAAEAQRGGNDIVNHHYIYDKSDLSLNTVQMTRSDHTSLHMLLKKLGYIVPHINVKVK